MAADHDGDVSIAGDAWDAMFDRGAEQRAPGETQVTPYWEDPGEAKVERPVKMLPFTREVGRYVRPRRSVAAYRMAFGAPQQEELVAHLASTHTEDELAELGRRFRDHLSPPCGDGAPYRFQSLLAA